jgi:hypothetical protein
MCASAIVTTSGVLMQNSTIRSARNQLAVVGMLISVGMFSIASVDAARHHRPTPQVQFSAQQVGTTPTGVFGWD